MNRHARIHRPVFASLTLSCVAAAWWGCSAGAGKQTTEVSAASSTSSSASSGNGGAGGANFDGGGGSTHEDAGVCTSVSATAATVPLDIVFLIDNSINMTGKNWSAISSGLTMFWNDPASDGIGAGLILFPRAPYVCATSNYNTFDVPMGTLPGNAFALTNALPAAAATSDFASPLYNILQGGLQAATAYQDANPTHKVVLVWSTDGDADVCDISFDDFADVAAGALGYNGVLTFVMSLPDIGGAGGTLAQMNQVAKAGGTTAAYSVTSDLTQFYSTIAQIRQMGAGCTYTIPPPPGNEQLDPNEVNFSYDPMGMGMPVILPRATNLAACAGGPGWYYDNNTSPTQILLCPATCSVVEADSMANVSVLFGCKTVIK